MPREVGGEIGGGDCGAASRARGASPRPSMLGGHCELNGADAQLPGRLRHVIPPGSACLHGREAGRVARPPMSLALRVRSTTAISILAAEAVGRLPDRRAAEALSEGIERLDGKGEQRRCAISTTTTRCRHLDADECVLDTPLLRLRRSPTRGPYRRRGPRPAAACEAMRRAFSGLIADRDWLPGDYQHAVPESGMGGGIGQWLLFRAADRSLCLFSLVVPPARRRRSTTTSPGVSSASTAEARTRSSTRPGAGRSRAPAGVRSRRATSTS